MPTDLAHLTLMQWLSPAYPVGAFAYSHGLERAVSAGDVTDVPSFEAWLTEVLTHGAGRSDAILLHAAYHATGTAALTRLDDLARALCPSSERRMETELQGAAFAVTTAEIQSTTAAPATYPVAVGSAARRAGIDPVLTAASFLQAFAANLTSAAIRLIPLGQTDGQRVLARMASLCQSLAQETAHLDTEDIGTSCFAADIASMQHETEYTRLFRS